MSYTIRFYKYRGPSLFGLTSKIVTEIVAYIPGKEILIGGKEDTLTLMRIKKSDIERMIEDKRLRLWYTNMISTRNVYIITDALNSQQRHERLQDKASGLYLKLLAEAPG